MKKLFSFLLLPFILFANFDDSQLVVGTTSGYAPYVSLNERGEYEGFDIDVAEALAEKMGKKLVLKDYGSMPGLLMALKQKKVDLLIWAISITSERMQKMEMIHYQGKPVDQMPLVFWKQIPEGLQGFQDVDTTVSVEAGSYQESVLKKYPKMKLKNLSSINDAILDLKFGKSKATCVDEALLPRLKEQFPELRVVYCSLPPEERSLGNGICIEKSNSEFAAEIKKVVEELVADGTIAKLEEKWGLVQ